MTVNRTISILGSTGSIGVNVLNVVRDFPQHFSVAALAAGRNIHRLAEQIMEFRPRMASVLTEELAAELKQLLGGQADVDVRWGQDGFVDIASVDEADTVVSSMVGAAGLIPTWAAIQKGRRIALANKETLVMAGELVMAEARAQGAEILPVDSEHSAIFQVLAGQQPENLKRIILTASGGPFRDWNKNDLAKARLEDALAHPNWNMGAKITIDSATLMNKGLETIEAKWLFGLEWDEISIHIHPQSIVHSMIELIDGSVLAQLGVPDMRVPIAYAMAYPDRLPLELPRLNLTQSPALTFSESDPGKFPCLALALQAGRRGGCAPAVLNAANEVAVQAFLDKDIRYVDIAKIVGRVLNEQESGDSRTLEHIMNADRASRQSARRVIEEIKKDSI